LNRFKNPRVVTNGNDIHVSYYDRVSGALKYWYNYTGTRVSDSEYASTNADTTRKYLGTGTTAIAETTSGSIQTHRRPVLASKRHVSIDGGYDAAWDGDSDTKTQQHYWYTTNDREYGGTAWIGTVYGKYYQVGAIIGNGEALFNYGSHTDNGSWKNDWPMLSHFAGKVTEINNTVIAQENKRIVGGTGPYTNTSPSTSGGSTAIITVDTRRVRTESRTNSGNTGLWSAIDVIAGDGSNNSVTATNTLPPAHNWLQGAEGGGYPVIAYYDSANRKLKLAYSNAKRPLSGWNWQVQDIPTGAYDDGQYVSMRINKANNDIHIAFYRGTNELVYIRGMRNTPDANNFAAYTFSAPVVVDDTGTVGEWADLSLDVEGKPWITYRDAGGGSYNSIKVAYIPGGDTGYANSANWETMTVPNRYPVITDRLNIENHPSGTPWKAAVGYRSSDLFRISYFVE
jgi:hypothetical protein